ncbi:MAG: N-acetyltransferase family protein [Hyphomicrobiales bacterium]
MEIRDARDGDLEAILAIYNDAVVNTTAIWNETLVDLENRRAWLAARQEAGFPVLVAADGAEVFGYASFGTFRPIDGFHPTVEHSIYIRPESRGRGIGGPLLEALVARAEALGKHVMVAAIDAGNDGSIRFHARNGFVEVGRMPEVGIKFGRRLDLVLLQRRLG